jgi:hypothetical protein
LQEAHFSRFFNGAAEALFRLETGRIEEALPERRVAFLYADRIAVRAERDAVKSAALR